jgi:hypothetical protein
MNQRRRSFPGAMAAQALWYHAPPVRRTNSGTSCVIRSHPLMPSSGSADSIKCWHGDVFMWCGNPNWPEFQQGKYRPGKMAGNGERKPEIHGYPKV